MEKEIIVKNLKQVSQNLNRKECPSQNEIFRCSNLLYECLYAIPENIKTKYKESTADLLNNFYRNYDSFCPNYIYKRVIIEQIRGKIGQLIQDINSI